MPTKLISKSKDTYGQTSGLSNLEMRHVGELAISGVLFKAVKTSRVVPRKVASISQSEGYFVGFCCTHITNTYVQNS